MKKTEFGHRAPVTSPDTLANSTRLAPRARELLQDQSKGLPVWVRPPKVGVEFYSGFSRAKLYECAGKGHFRSVSIREPGQAKGTRLFHLGSILDFIERCEAAAKTIDAEGSRTATSERIRGDL